MLLSKSIVWCFVHGCLALKFDIGNSWQKRMLKSSWHSPVKHLSCKIKAGEDKSLQCYKHSPKAQVGKLKRKGWSRCADHWHNIRLLVTGWNASTGTPGPLSHSHILGPKPKFHKWPTLNKASKSTQRTSHVYIGQQLSVATWPSNNHRMESKN